mmetsp:Transcript_18905/g.43412  ORF Transcript_18905/g.43412 Transcript_18905/m.43412 type:complete len:225 (-) Transcript_18905:5569-6243(-)
MLMEVMRRVAAKRGVRAGGSAGFRQDLADDLHLEDRASGRLPILIVVASGVDARRPVLCVFLLVSHAAGVLPDFALALVAPAVIDSPALALALFVLIGTKSLELRLAANRPALVLVVHIFGRVILIEARRAVVAVVKGEHGACAGAMRFVCVHVVEPGVRRREGNTHRAIHRDDFVVAHAAALSARLRRHVHVVEDCTPSRRVIVQRSASGVWDVVAMLPFALP